MTQVYVSEMPKTAEKCPFYSNNNRKCNVTNEKCCMEKNTECHHLIVLRLDFAEEEYYTEE